MESSFGRLHVNLQDYSFKWTQIKLIVAENSRS